MLTKDQIKQICSKIDCEGFDYYFCLYSSPKHHRKEYKDEKLVELHEKFLQARRELNNYVQFDKWVEEHDE